MVGRDVVFQVEKAPPSPVDVVLRVGDLRVARRPWRARPSTGSRSRCAAARSSASPASRATASASWSRRSPGCAARSAARSRSSATTPPSSRPARSPTSARPTSPRTAASTALVGSYSIADNLVLNRFDQAPFARRGIRNSRAIDAEARRLVARVRRAHAGHRRRRRDALGRQPAEGHRRPRADGRRQGAVRRPADAGPRRRLDRVHPPPDHRPARPGRRRAARVGRARRDPLAVGPHRRALPRPAGRRVRRRRRRPARARLPDGHRGRPPSPRSSSDERATARATVRSWIHGWWNIQPVLVPLSPCCWRSSSAAC